MGSQFLHHNGQLVYASGASQSHSNISYASEKRPYSPALSSSSKSSSSSLSSSPRYAMDAAQQQTGSSVEIMRCSRCAKTVEVIGRRSSDGTVRVSSSDATASGMVRFGHNLYYCDRCAKMVGYK